MKISTKKEEAILWLGSYLSRSDSYDYFLGDWGVYKNIVLLTIQDPYDGKPELHAYKVRDVLKLYRKHNEIWNVPGGLSDLEEDRLIQELDYSMYDARLDIKGETK